MSKFMFYPFLILLKKTLKSRQFIILFLVFAFLVFALNIFINSESKNNSISDLKIFYTLNTVVISLMLILIFAYFTSKLLIYDIKWNAHKVEMRYGFSYKNIYFSRILVLAIIFLLTITFTTLVNLIFFLSTNHDGVTRYMLYITPIAWYCIVSLVTVSTLLIFGMLINEIAGLIMTVMFCIAFMVIGSLGAMFVKPSASKPNALGGIDVTMNSVNATKFFAEINYLSEINKVVGSEYKFIFDFIEDNIDGNENETIVNQLITPTSDEQINKFNISVEKTIIDIPNWQELNFSNNIKLTSKILSKTLKSSDEIIMKTYADFFEYVEYYKEYGIFQLPSEIVSEKFLLEIIYNQIIDSYRWFHYGNYVMFDGQLYTEVLEKIKLNTIFNPLAQINKMFFGNNYYYDFMSELINGSSSIFGSYSNWSSDIKFEVVENSMGMIVIKGDPKVKTSVPIEIIYLMYSIFSISISTILVFKFRKNILK